MLQTPPLNSHGLNNSLLFVTDAQGTVTLLRLRQANYRECVVLRAFVKGSPPFLREGFEMFKTFAVDELLIYIRTVFSYDRKLYILHDSPLESRQCDWPLKD